MKKQNEIQQIKIEYWNININKIKLDKIKLKLR